MGPIPSQNGIFPPWTPTITGVGLSLIAIPKWGALTAPEGWPLVLRQQNWAICEGFWSQPNGPFPPPKMRTRKGQDRTGLWLRKMWNICLHSLSQAHPSRPMDNVRCHYSSIVKFVRAKNMEISTGLRPPTGLVNSENFQKYF